MPRLAPSFPALALAAVIATLAPPSLLHAQDQQSSVEARLREGLRNTMLQLRDAQGQIATLQAAQVENEQKIKDFTAQVEKLTKQGVEDRLAADKTITGLKEQIAGQDTRNAQLIDALGKWKKAYNDVAATARATEQKRAELADKVIKLDRKVADQQAKNQAMYKLGTEILARYERFGLGDALLAREPFVGVTRVKFQNLIQDYSDKLTDQKIKP